MPCLQQHCLFAYARMMQPPRQALREAATTPKICQGTLKGPPLTDSGRRGLLSGELDGAGRTAQEAVHFSNSASEDEHTP